MTNLGFYIAKLSIVGPTRPPAVLDFADGLNVVSGASDTGKSFALSCIDFTFGAREAPRQIPEVEAYRFVALELIARQTQERLTIERGLAGGDARVIRRDPAGNVLSDSTIRLKHDAKESNTLSGLFLGLSGLWGLQVRKNARGERRSLSFRDVAYLCVVDEERIIAERPPHLSDSPVERTVEREVFRTLITGSESGEVVVVPGKEDLAGLEAKVELIEGMINESLNDFQKTGLKQDELGKELAEIEGMRNAALAEYERVRQSVTQLEAALGERSHELREAQTRIAVVDGLLQRFQLLNNHYDSDIQRLAAIEESGQILQSLPSKPCPVCGALPESHRVDHAGEQFQLPLVRSAATVETQKIKILKEDLSRVLGDLNSERNALLERANSARSLVDGLQSKISTELTPSVSASAQALKAQNDRRDILIRGKAILDQIEKLRKQSAELNTSRANAKASSPRVVTAATTAEMDPFAQEVQAVLTAWNYPNPGRVMFSETSQDLIIGGHPRASHGKGVRALTCAAFILGIMRHCRNKNLPHPSVVVLDSPLVAYREPDINDAEIQQLRLAGVKEAFYKSLASGLAAGQVIIFENEDPPETVKSTRHHFTKSNVGRYGLFPPQ